MSLVQFPVMLDVNVPGFPSYQGKVRNRFDFGSGILLWQSDRISANDWVIPTGISQKGRVLTSISKFWFTRLSATMPNHFISCDVNDFPKQFQLQRSEFEDRAMLCRKASSVIPFECIVRGYLTGSGLKDYQKTGAVCGIQLPSGLVDGSKLPKPIFTPSTKAQTGHDVNIDFETMKNQLRDKKYYAHPSPKKDVAEHLKHWSIAIYEQAHHYALDRGIIIADTKFEFGFDENGQDIILIDEVLTPDSSRFWPAKTYEPGKSQPSLDKQPVRDWLNRLKQEGKWDDTSTPPELPKEEVLATSQRYLEIERLLIGDIKKAA